MPSSSVVCFELLESMEKLKIARFATNSPLVPLEKFHLKTLFGDFRETFFAADVTKVTKNSRSGKVLCTHLEDHVMGSAQNATSKRRRKKMENTRELASPNDGEEN